MGPFGAARRAGGLLATPLSLPSLPGCAELHLDQGLNQVIQRTEGEDNFALKQYAGPVAARVLPYALLAEQSFDPRVYGTLGIAPRATACVTDDGKPCAPADDRRIRRVYEFDPSMVTGFYSVDPPHRDRNAQGLRMERTYEFGEVLAIMLRSIPLSPCNPRVVRVRVFHGAPIALHSLRDLDNGLLRIARGHEPETSPMVLEPCGIESPKTPIAAAQ